MSFAAVLFYADKFFPHLPKKHGVDCVMAILKSKGIVVTK